MCGCPGEVYLPSSQLWLEQWLADAHDGRTSDDRREERLQPTSDRRRIFPNTDSGVYWTSTKNGSHCWMADFQIGLDFIITGNDCDSAFAVRLVRGRL